MELKKYEVYAKPVLRIGLAFVFLYFSFQQLTNPEAWTHFVPTIALVTSITAKQLVITNAFFELIFGVFLLLGLYTRISSALLGLHLLGIATSIGLNPLGVRDLGLAIATFVIFLNGPDRYSFDVRFKKMRS